MESDEKDLQELLAPDASNASSSRDGKVVSEWLFQPAQFSPLFAKKRGRPELPKPQLLWVDARGQVTRQKLSSALRWTWASEADSPAEKHPVLRIFIALPSGAKLDAASSSAGEKVSPSDADWESAFKGVKNLTEDEVVVFQGLNSQITGTVSYTLKGVREQVGWVVRLNPGAPILWTHPDCLERGLVMGFPGQVAGIQERASDEFAVAPFLALSLYCRSSGSRIHFSLKRTSDAEWLGGKVIHPETGVFQDLFTLGAPSQSLQSTRLEWEWSPEVQVKEQALIEGDFTEVAAFRARGVTVPGEPSDSFLVGIVRSRGWEGQLSSPIRTGLTWNLGLGASFIDYVEDEGDTARIQLTTLTLTGGMLWRFHPRWDVSWNGFVNGVPLSNQATRNLSGTETPFESQLNYYGLNLRGGWRFSSPRGGLDWRLAGGIYFWGMLVNPPEFGIRSLLGPQFFVQVRNNQKLARPWGAYIKYAVTGSGFSYNFGNFEGAAGGDIQLGRIFEKPISAVIDISYAQFAGRSQDASGSAFDKNMQMTTLSLGTRIQF
jgi:hypothetical protein